MPLNLPQSFMAGTYASAGSTLASTPHRFSRVDASTEVDGIKRSAAAVAVRRYQVLRWPRSFASGTKAHAEQHFLEAPPAVQAVVKPGSASDGPAAKKRRVLFPSVPRAAACGSCPACLNPAWKQACQTRRLEAAAHAAGAWLCLRITSGWLIKSPHAI